jgi:hypothetical protein
MNIYLSSEEERNIDINYGKYGHKKYIISDNSDDSDVYDYSEGEKKSSEDDTGPSSNDLVLSQQHKSKFDSDHQEKRIKALIKRLKIKGKGKMNK